MHTAEDATNSTVNSNSDAEVPAAVPAPSRRWAFVFPALLIVVCAVVATLATTGDEPSIPTSRPPPVLTLEQDGLRLVYHVPTRAAALFDVAADPHCRRNLLPGREDDAAELRERLEEQLGVPNLDALSEAYEVEVRQLRSLGYL